MNGDWLSHDRSMIPVTGSRARRSISPTERGSSCNDSRALSAMSFIRRARIRCRHWEWRRMIRALDAQLSEDSAQAKRRGPIKPALMDQKVIAGLGNIYAAEALWRAKISPRAVASSLSKARLERLVDAIHRRSRGGESPPGAIHGRRAANASLSTIGKGVPCLACAHDDQANSAGRAVDLLLPESANRLRMPDRSSTACSSAPLM